MAAWCLHSVWKILTPIQQWEKYFIRSVKASKGSTLKRGSITSELAPLRMAKNTHTLALSSLRAVHRCWGGSKWKLAYPIMAWRQGATPPGCEPADWVSHLGGRESSHRARSIRPGALPLWERSQRDSLRELAGMGARRSLRQAGARFDDSSIQPRSKTKRGSLYLTQSGRSQRYPNCCVNVRGNLFYSHS